MKYYGNPPTSISSTSVELDPEFDKELLMHVNSSNEQENIHPDPIG